MIKSTNVVYELLPGNYYIGDISYFLQDSIINKIHFKQDNIYFNGDNKKGLVVIKPSYGNGLYEGSDNFIYDIEENNIGIVHVSLGKKSKFTGCGTFHSFVNPVRVTIANHIFIVESGLWNLNINMNDCYNIPSDDEGYDSWG
jgi:hypothetical protein